MAGRVSLGETRENEILLFGRQHIFEPTGLRTELYRLM
jgi:hypothetical protein